MTVLWRALESFHLDLAILEHVFSFRPVLFLEWHAPIPVLSSDLLVEQMTTVGEVYGSVQ